MHVNWTDDKRAVSVSTFGHSPKSSVVDIGLHNGAQNVHVVMDAEQFRTFLGELNGLFAAWYLSPMPKRAA